MATAKIETVICGNKHSVRAAQTHWIALPSGCTCWRSCRGSSCCCASASYYRPGCPPTSPAACSPAASGTLLSSLGNPPACNSKCGIEWLSVRVDMREGWGFTFIGAPMPMECPETVTLSRTSNHEHRANSS